MSILTSITPVLVLGLAVSCVLTLPVQNSQNRHRRDLQGLTGQSSSAVSEPLMRMILRDKGHLLEYLSSRSHEEKRQRQCYWSVISCY